MNIRIEPGSVQVMNNYINGYEFDFVAILGSREGYYSPVVDVPETTVNQHAIVITHINIGIFTIIISGLPGETIIIDWGDGTPPQTIILTGGDDTITHDYTGTTGEHVIVIEGEENIITIEADGQDITEITIPPTAINLEELILPNNDIINSPDIPDTVPLIILDLSSNPLTITEVTIGTQVWMLKNYASNYPGSKVYDNDEFNRAIYGGLYTWMQVNAAGFCPSGWHVPSQAEWQQLIDYLFGDAVAGEKLKEDGLTHWLIDNANNSSGFTALGAGVYIGGFIGLKQYGFFWTSSEHNVSMGEAALMDADTLTCEVSQGTKSNYLSVRLLKNYSVPLVPTSYDDWFLPSLFELNAMYNELYLFGVGGFGANIYWSSSEFGALFSYVINFSTGAQTWSGKGSILRVRACRAFTSSFAYALRDVGPAGGLIFYKNGNNYLEAPPSDQSAGYVWSNIVNVLIGTTGTTIGTGQANTTAIINQAGHVDSAAKLCDDLIIVH
jgi:uncharacterized protein (TIGR02145 family)